MSVERRILSPRLADDGRSWIRLSPEQRRARSEFLEEFGKNDYWFHDACPACGGGDSVLVARKDLYGLPTDNHACRNCGLIFKNPLLTPEAAGRYYGRISYRLRGKDPSAEARASLFSMRAKTFAAERYAFVRNHFSAIPEGSLVAELGTYDGANLVPFGEAGFRTIGFDIDDGAFGPGREQGLDLRVGVPGCVSLEEKPTLVILSHFVEHLARPVEELGAIRALMPAEGRLFVEVPGVREIGGRDLLGYFMAEHNFSFDLSSLNTMMSGAGFGLVAGDETVRALFAPDAVGVGPRGSNGSDLLKFLDRKEAEFRGWGARAVYHRLRVFAINDILYRLTR